MCRRCNYGLCLFKCGVTSMASSVVSSVLASPSDTFRRWHSLMGRSAPVYRRRARGFLRSRSAAGLVLPYLVGNDRVGCQGQKPGISLYMACSQSMSQLIASLLVKALPSHKSQRAGGRGIYLVEELSIGIQHFPRSACSSAILYCCDLLVLISMHCVVENAQMP